MSRKEIAGARFPQFHGARIRRNFVSISVLQRCPILDTGRRRGKGKGREGRDIWDGRIHTCTIVVQNVQLFGRVLNVRRHTSNANTRIAHYTPAAPIVLLPPVRSSSLLPLPSITTVSDPMIFAFLWITFTMALRVHELFLILHGPDTAQKEKFISNNNSKWICGNYRGERTWNNFSFNVKACNNFRGNCSKIN